MPGEEGKLFTWSSCQSFLLSSWDSSLPNVTVSVLSSASPVLSQVCTHSIRITSHVTCLSLPSLPLTTNIWQNINFVTFPNKVWQVVSEYKTSDCILQPISPPTTNTLENFYIFVSLFQVWHNYWNNVSGILTER